MTRKFFTLLLLLAATMTYAQLPSGYSPCSVNNLTAEWVAAEGTNSVEIKFNAPTQMQKYDMSIQDYVIQDMDADITKIVVQRSEGEAYSFLTVKTFDAPVKGEQLSCTDTGLTYGVYRYRVIVYVGSAKSDDWDWQNAIRTVIVGQVPADYTDDDVSVTSEGNTVKMKFKAPAVSSMGAPMTDDMTCTIAEVTGSEPPVFTTYHSVSHAVPGQEYEFTLSNVKDGMHTYAFQASTTAGGNNGVYRYSVNVFVGKDVPGKVRNAKAVNAEQGGVLISWEAPLMGKNGGDMGNVQDITYTVIRKTSNFDPAGHVVASKIKNLQCFDDITSLKQTSYIYSIEASNNMGSGEEATTNSVFVGPKGSLPFVEGFETLDGYGNPSFDNVWLKDYSGNYSSWYTATSMWIDNAAITVQPHTGNSLGYAMYMSWGTTNKWDALTSGPVDCSLAQYPVVSVWVYDIKQDNAPMTFKVQASVDGGITFNDAVVKVLGNADKAGWTNLVAILPEAIGAGNVQVRILSIASGINCFPIVVDDFCFEDNKEMYETTAIADVAISKKHDGSAYNLAGQRVNAKAKGIVIINGKKVLNR